MAEVKNALAETKEYVLLNGIGQWKSLEEFEKLKELGINSDASVKYNVESNKIYTLLIHNDKARVSLDSQGGKMAQAVNKPDDGLDIEAEKIFNAINENEIENLKDVLQEFFENGDAISLNIQPSWNKDTSEFMIAINSDNINLKTDLRTTQLLNRKTAVKRFLETECKNYMNSHNINKYNLKADKCDRASCISESCMG